VKEQVATKKWGRKNPNLDAEIAAHGHIVGVLHQEIPRRGALVHHLPLGLVEIGGKRGEINLGEERPLQHRVHAVDGA